MEKFSFIFSGQGTQFIQMGQSFYNNYLISRQTYDEANEVHNQDIAKLCFEGRLSALNEFTNMQIAIVTTEVAIYRAYVQEFGVIPQFAAGHSIGEYAAMICSGAIGFGDALRILKKRGELVQRIIDLDTGRMTIVEKVNSEMVSNLIKEMKLEERVYLSCYNSNSQLAVSGFNEDLDRLEEKLVQIGCTVSPLFGSPPMHSPLMSSIADEYKQFLEGFDYYSFRFPIVSNVTGAPFSDVKSIPQLLSSHLVSPVKWVDSVNIMHGYGITAAVEMGPKLLLSGFVTDIRPDIKTFCYGLKKDRLALSDIFKADASYTKDVPKLFGRCLGIIAATENKNDDSEEFEKVIKLYGEIQEMCINAEQKKQMDDEDEENAIQMLIEALRIKGLTAREIKGWVKNLIDETANNYKLKSVFSN
jgi:[acyl-carrier-protein] S-malonyltransferase